MSLPSTSELLSKYSNHSVTVLAFYIPGQLWIQDEIVVRNNQYVGRYSNKTLEQSRDEYPTLTIISLDEAAKIIEDSAKQPVREIDNARYEDMLEVLPPIDWKIAEGADSFKFMEMYSGNITDIFASIITDEFIDPDNQYSARVRRYFTLRDHVRMPHTEIIKLCREFMTNGIAAEADNEK